jgi:hypothetical protein
VSVVKRVPSAEKKEKSSREYIMFEALQLQTRNIRIIHLKIIFCFLLDFYSFVHLLLFKCFQKKFSTILLYTLESKKSEILQFATLFKSLCLILNFSFSSQGLRSKNEPFQSYIFHPRCEKVEIWSTCRSSSGLAFTTYELIRIGFISVGLISLNRFSFNSVDNTPVALLST